MIFFNYFGSFIHLCWTKFLTRYCKIEKKKHTVQCGTYCSEKYQGFFNQLFCINNKINKKILNNNKCLGSPNKSFLNFSHHQSQNIPFNLPCVSKTILDAIFYWIQSAINLHFFLKKSIFGTVARTHKKKEQIKH